MRSLIIVNYLAVLRAEYENLDLDGQCVGRTLSKILDGYHVWLYLFYVTFPLNCILYVEPYSCWDVMTMDVYVDLYLYGDYMILDAYFDPLTSACLSAFMSSIVTMLNDQQ